MENTTCKDYSFLETFSRLSSDSQYRILAIAETLHNIDESINETYRDYGRQQ